MDPVRDDLSTEMLEGMRDQGTLIALAAWLRLMDRRLSEESGTPPQGAKIALMAPQLVEPMYEGVLIGWGELMGDRRFAEEALAALRARVEAIPEKPPEVPS